MTREDMAFGDAPTLEKYGASHGAVVTITHARARTVARRAEDVGAAPYRDRHVDFDATVVKRFGTAGTVLLAKLAMVELAGGFGYDEENASCTGPGRTRLNRDYRTGGTRRLRARVGDVGLDSLRRPYVYADLA